MDYRTIGHTGMRVSALSFGASSLGGVFHAIDEGRAIEALHTAVEGGMNFIDVSPYYGHYRAEAAQHSSVRKRSRSPSHYQYGEKRDTQLLRTKFSQIRYR